MGRDFYDCIFRLRAGAHAHTLGRVVDAYGAVRVGVVSISRSGSVIFLTHHNQPSFPSPNRTEHTILALLVAACDAGVRYATQTRGLGTTRFDWCALLFTSHHACACMQCIMREPPPLSGARVLSVTHKNNGDVSMSRKLGVSGPRCHKISFFVGWTHVCIGRGGKRQECFGKPCCIVFVPFRRWFFFFFYCCQWACTCDGIFG